MARLDSNEKGNGVKSIELLIEPGMSVSNHGAFERRTKNRVIFMVWPAAKALRHPPQQATQPECSFVKGLDSTPLSSPSAELGFILRYRPVASGGQRPRLPASASLRPRA